MKDKNHGNRALQTKSDDGGDNAAEEDDILRTHQQLNTVESLIREAINTHITIDQITEMLDGKASEALTARARAHFRQCKLCEARYIRLSLNECKKSW